MDKIAEAKDKTPAIRVPSFRGVAVGGAINYGQGEAFFDSAATSAVVGGALGKVFDVYTKAAGNSRLIRHLDGIKGDVLGFGINP